MPPDDQPEDAEHSGGTGGLLILLIIWSAGIGVLTAVVFGATWLAEQFQIVSNQQPSPWPAVILTLIYAALVILPARWAGRRVRQTRPKAVLDTWVAAGLFVLFCLPVRFVPVGAGQTGALLQIVCASLFVLVARRRLATPAGTSAIAAAPPYWTAVVAASIVSVFWILWGAAGSWLDVLLNFVAALALGSAAAVIWRQQLLPSLAATDDDPRANVALGGLAMAAALAAMGAGFGTTGQQLILLFLLPSLGWLLMGVAYFGRGHDFPLGWAAAGLTLALAAAAPMILIDQEELVLILNLGTRDVGQWAARATFVSSAVALLLGLLAIVFARRLPDVHIGRIGPLVAAVTTGLLAAVYLFSGQVGFHGERLFVIMQEQASWDSPVLPEEYWIRRATVYEDLVDRSDRTQASIRQTLDRLGVDYTPYYLANALEVDGGPLLRWWLAIPAGSGPDSGQSALAAFARAATCFVGYGRRAKRAAVEPDQYRGHECLADLWGHGGRDCHRASGLGRRTIAPRAYPCLSR